MIKEGVKGSNRYGRERRRRREIKGRREQRRGG
jgi:hypothetical protein